MPEQSLDQVRQTVDQFDHVTPREVNETFFPDQALSDQWIQSRVPGVEEAVTPLPDYDPNPSVSATASTSKDGPSKRQMAIGAAVALGIGYVATKGGA